ncbi:MAG: hypothetical protein NDI81_03040 [Desulfobacula sp.]|jgi:hypothetical protein|nr:hypothetical protein [Desulfobacula sp.]
MKKFRLLAVFILIYVFALPPGGLAAPEMNSDGDCITKFETGTVNWTTGMITASGKASPADQSPVSKESVFLYAKAEAVKNILSTLKQIKINNEWTVSDYASENLIILAGLEKTAREAPVSKQIYTSALAVEITLKTSLFGGFLQLVLPEEIRQIPKINPEINPKILPVIGKSLYSGLVIDARGLDIEPVLDPVIVSEQGHDVYSSVFISREFAVQNGICKYVCNLDQAVRDKRIGDNPMILKGLRKEGSKNATLVISMSDYLVLEKTTERHAFLNECRVIIVRD